MRKYFILICASYLIGSFVYAFKPATLFIETLDGIKRVEVKTKEQANKLFSQEYELEKGRMLGTTITTISGSTNIKDLGTILPNNFTALNNGKIEISTTTLPLLTTLSNLTTVGTLSSGSWNAMPIPVNKGGTGTTTPSNYLVMLGNGSGGLTVASSTGTTGQFLTSNGAGAYPSFQTASVNQTTNYNWTGTHSFSATTTMATTTITSATIATSSITTLNLNGVNAGNLVGGNNADSLHIHTYEKLKMASTTSAFFDNTNTDWPVLATTTITGGTLGTGNVVVRAKVFITDLDLDNGQTMTYTSHYGTGGGANVSVIINNTSGTTISNLKGWITVEIIGNLATNSQLIFISTSFGNGVITDAAVDSIVANNAAYVVSSVDSTADQPFSISALGSSALDINARGGYIEILK